MLQSYNTPERKDRARDPHGGIMIYVKMVSITKEGMTWNYVVFS